jgi:hypothetical protein
MMNGEEGFRFICSNEQKSNKNLGTKKTKIPKICNTVARARWGMHRKVAI